MVHDMMAMAAEAGINTVLPSYGYEVNGFAQNLQHPSVSKCVDECLVEIAQTTDVLEYIESPYARLGIAKQDLIHRMANEFDLVICFIGSAACNPFLEHLLTLHWDPRFFFSEWDDRLVEKLLTQQESLLKTGVRREVLILVDDVVLTSNADEQLAHMAMRGRHFRISLLMCSVSYTSLPKRMRRSLDVLMVYSCPMRGDLLILTQEYCQGNNGVARFMLNNLDDHQCLVLETLTKKQQLYTWKADLLELRDKSIVHQNTASPASAESEKSGIGHEAARV
jgi:hypothetical protein